MLAAVWGTQIDGLVDKATSELLPGEDLAANMQICDLIRSKQVQASAAAKAIKRRLQHKNPNVQLLALKLLEMCVKNCGHHFHVEVAAKDFIDTLVGFTRVQIGMNSEVRRKTLDLIQSWGIAFRGTADLTYICDVFNLLRAEGVQFPPPDANGPGIMLDTNVAPEWSDSDVCMRCRSDFTTLRRKHHCRHCGQTFCYMCSSNSVPIPKFGMDKPVRVCDGCYAELSGHIAPVDVYAMPSHQPVLAEGSVLTCEVQMYQITHPLRTLGGGPSVGGAGLPPIAQPVGYGATGPTATLTTHRGLPVASTASAAPAVNPDDQFERDMQLALALSMQAAGGGAAGAGAGTSASKALPSPPKTMRPPQASFTAKPSTSSSQDADSDDDPDLAAAIAASLRDVQVSSGTGIGDYGGGSSVDGGNRIRVAPYPGAGAGAGVSPTPSHASGSPSPGAGGLTPPTDPNELSEGEKRNLQLFAELIQKIDDTGGDLLSNRPLREQYAKISQLQPRLIRCLEETDQKLRYYQELNARLTKALSTYDRLLEERLAALHRPAGAPVSPAPVIAVGPPPARPYAMPYGGPDYGAGSPAAYAAPAPAPVPTGAPAGPGYGYTPHGAPPPPAGYDPNYGAGRPGPDAGYGAPAPGPTGPTGPGPAYGGEAPYVDPHAAYAATGAYHSHPPPGQPQLQPLPDQHAPPPQAYGPTGTYGPAPPGPAEYAPAAQPPLQHHQSPPSHGYGYQGAPPQPTASPVPQQYAAGPPPGGYYDVPPQQPPQQPPAPVPGPEASLIEF